jgi:hypothetical protein
MTIEERENLLRKIRACYARADESRNENEHERATALRQANAMVEKFAVTAAELDSDELGPMGQNDVPVGMTIWKQSLYFVLGPLYGCEVLWNRRGTMYVMGRQSYRNVVEDMAGYVITSIEREAKAQARGDKTYLNGFRKWAVEGVRANVNDILQARKDAAATLGTGSKALVLVDHFKGQLEDASKYMNDTHRVSTGKARAMPRGGMEGYEAGRGIGLNDQMGTTRVKPAGVLK